MFANDAGWYSTARYIVPFLLRAGTVVHLLRTCSFFSHQKCFSLFCDHGADFGEIELVGCLRYTKLCRVGKHVNSIMKPTNSPTQGQPNARKIRLKKAIGPLFPIANNFSWVHHHQCYGIALNDLERPVITFVQVLGTYFITWEAYLRQETRGSW